MLRSTENMGFMKSLLLEPVDDALIIAGDVGYLVDSAIPHHPTDMLIGNTHLVSNSLGYVFCSGHSNINDSAVIEV